MTWAIMSLCIIASISSVEAKEDLATNQQVMCLAKNIYYEAGLESFEGKVAVAQVTINRTEDSKFPKTICGVVHQKTQVANRVICQFSWVCNPVSKIKYVSDRWKDSLNIARDVVHNDLRLEELDGALYFHNTHVRPNWGLERVARIGGHIFYSDDPAPKKRLTVSQK
jgi:spore germination cell wall hydrolase CwlJ-like protein